MSAPVIVLMSAPVPVLVLMIVGVPVIMTIVRVMIAVLVAVVGRVRDHFSPAGPAPGAGAGLAGAHRLSRFPNFQ